MWDCWQIYKRFLSNLSHYTAKGDMGSEISEDIMFLIEQETNQPNAKKGFN